MTRLNLIDPQDLTNRHLVAEYKEITQFMHLVKKRVDNKVPMNDIPREYTLNGGHCLFFYNKGSYVLDRFIHLRDEMLSRGLKVDENKFILRKQKILDSFSIPLMNNYTPSMKDYSIVIDRISQRIKEKPHLYPDSDRFFKAIGKYI